MAEDVFNEIDDALTAFIGEGELPDDQLQFLFGTPDSLAKMNPPLLRFGFATPDKEFDPGEISVKLNGLDVSDTIRYSVYYHQGRKANFCLATWMPDMYLNPQNHHAFDIQINPEKGRQLEKQLKFDVQNVNPPEIIFACFKPDDDRRFFYHNKIMVLTTMSPNVKIRDTLLNPNKWTINYTDLSLTPTISSIEKIKGRMYSISFNNDFEVGKMVSATFTPTDGVTTNVAEFKVPRRVVERGGEMVRKEASTLPDCETCQDDGQGHEYKFTDWLTDSADGCETLHHIDVDADCPPSECDPAIQQTIRYTYYQFEKDIFDDDSDNGHGYCYTIPPSTCWPCGDINHIYYFKEDVHVTFEMLAMDDPQQGYCLIHETPELKVLSDTTVPTFDEGATEFSIEEKCTKIWPLTCEDCELTFDERLPAGSDLSERKNDILENQ